MNVELTDERILILADRFSMEHAEGRAWTRRMDAFGTLAKMSGFLKQPKDDEFEIAYRERRLQPFWRIACSSVQAYERKREYSINVAAEVQSVVLGGRPGRSPARRSRSPARNTAARSTARRCSSTA